MHSSPRFEVCCLALVMLALLGLARHVHHRPYCALPPFSLRPEHGVPSDLCRAKLRKVMNRGLGTRQSFVFRANPRRQEPSLRTRLLPLLRSNSILPIPSVRFERVGTQEWLHSSQVNRSHGRSAWSSSLLRKSED